MKPNKDLIQKLKTMQVPDSLKDKALELAEKLTYMPNHYFHKQAEKYESKKQMAAELNSALMSCKDQSRLHYHWRYVSLN